MARGIGNLDDFKATLETAANQLVLVDFTATWCGPCKMIAPFFKGLVEKYPDVVFIELDVDDAQEVAAYCEIRSLPTFQFYKNGERIIIEALIMRDPLQHVPGKNLGQVDGTGSSKNRISNIHDLA